jgi:hypothetical protein
MRRRRRLNTHDLVFSPACRTRKRRWFIRGQDDLWQFRGTGLSLAVTPSTQTKKMTVEITATVALTVCTESGFLFMRRLRAALTIRRGAERLPSRRAYLVALGWPVNKPSAQN